MSNIEISLFSLILSYVFFSIHQNPLFEVFVNNHEHKCMFFKTRAKKITVKVFLFNIYLFHLRQCVCYLDLEHKHQ